MIRSSVAQAGGGARSTVALYQLFSCCQAFRGNGGSAPISASTSSPAVSTCLFLSPFRLAVIYRLSLQILVWSLAFCRLETLLSTSLHVSSKIDPLFLLSLACGFGTSLRRAAKIPSSCVGSAGGRRGRRLSPVRYLVCSLSGALQRNPRII